MNILHPIAMPKPIRAPAAPKIDHVRIAKLPGGYKVNHVMTHGAPAKTFTFQDPTKIQKHLARIQNNAWRSPDSNPGNSITRGLNLAA